MKMYLDTLRQGDYGTIINTSGDRNRKLSVLRICAAMRDAGAVGFGKFADLDESLTEMGQTIIQFEDDIREFLNEVLSELNPEWCTGIQHKKLSKEVFDRIISQRLRSKIKQMEAQGLKFNPRQYYEGLTLGEVFDIVKNNENWTAAFESIFTMQFTDKEVTIHNFKTIIDLRDKLIHKKGPDTLITPENVEICRMLLRQIYKCIESWREKKNLEQENA